MTNNAICPISSGRDLTFSQATDQVGFLPNESIEVLGKCARECMDGVVANCPKVTRCVVDCMKKVFSLLRESSPDKDKEQLRLIYTSIEDYEKKLGSCKQKTEEKSPKIPQEHVVITRKEQKIEDTWNLEALFSGLKEWKEAFQKELSIDYEAMFSRYKSLVKLAPKDISEILEIFENLERNLDKLYVYAYLTFDGDITNDEAVEAYQAVTSRRADFFKATSWIKAKILSHEQHEIEEFVQAKEILPHSVHLKSLLRLKPHFLSMKEEELLSFTENAPLPPTGVFENAYTSLVDGDMIFPDIEDKDGKKHPLTNALSWGYIKSPDRIFRKNALDTRLDVYKKHEQVLTTLLLGQIKNHHFHAKARGYSSCLEAALYPQEIPTSVYHNLIATTRERVSVLHRYTALIKKYLHLDKVYHYDIPPFTEENETKYSYDEAVSFILEACRPLGTSYVERLKKGLTTDRWVDRYANAHKRSGSFSHGCYDSPPYIHVQFDGTLSSVSMLAHEAGHSMNSELSRRQPYGSSVFPVYKYPTFTAEVASTFHEALLANFLIEKFQNDPALQLKTILAKLDNMRMYLFDQVLFAEFELFLHESLEQGKPITAKILNEKNKELFSFYYGEDFAADDSLAGFWSIVPHYYYNFYVYQYATGISAAQALAEKVRHGGEKERLAYLHFLESGRSESPLDVLRSAGVDMATKEPIEQAIKRFDELLDVFERLI